MPQVPVGVTAHDVRRICGASSPSRLTIPSSPLRRCIFVTFVRPFSASWEVPSFIHGDAMRHSFSFSEYAQQKDDRAIRGMRMTCVRTPHYQGSSQEEEDEDPRGRSTDSIRKSHKTSKNPMTLTHVGKQQPKKSSPFFTVNVETTRSQMNGETSSKYKKRNEPRSHYRQMMFQTTEMVK